VDQLPPVVAETDFEIDRSFPVSLSSLLRSLSYYVTPSFDVASIAVALATRVGASKSLRRSALSRAPKCSG
jgi:hypothetical protein